MIIHFEMSPIKYWQRRKEAEYKQFNDSGESGDSDESVDSGESCDLCDAGKSGDSDGHCECHISYHLTPCFSKNSM